MNNEFDNTTDDQIIAMLRAGPLTGDPVIEEAAERMASLLDMMRRMAMTSPGADRIEAAMQSHRATIRMVRECIEELFGSVASRKVLPVSISGGRPLSSGTASLVVQRVATSGVVSSIFDH